MDSPAAAWLAGLIDVERMPDRREARFTLAPIRALLARVGNPQRGLPVIHVAGSKGKGSTVLMVEALLEAAGRRSASFTSPHLERWTERFRVGGVDVSEAQLEAAVERLRPAVEAIRRDDPVCMPTFFDATTAAAFLIFADAGVDVAVLEVGLGGRSDSTNVCEPIVTCVTSIELEHTAVLGDTLAAIAGEKAGILKRGVPAVAGALPDEALAVVSAHAAELDAPLAVAGIDFAVTAREAGPEGQRIEVRDGGFRSEAHLAALGTHQAHNAALAVACVRRAGVSDARVAKAMGSAFAEIALPGRIEILHREPWHVVDSAHTPASARMLRAALDVLPRRREHWVLSISRDKDSAELCRILLRDAAIVTLTRAEPRRSLDPADVAAVVRAAAPATRIEVVPNPHLALRAAAERLEKGDLLCAAGSVYLAGIARAVLGGGIARPVTVSRRSKPAAAPVPDPERRGGS